MAHRTGVALAALLIGTGGAGADSFTLRIGAGHPNGPSVYVTDMATFFVPQVTRRVAEETEHEVEFVEGYGGAIAGVAEVLEAVESGILDIGGMCFCFEPAKLYLHNFPYYAPFGPADSVQEMQAARATYDKVPFLTEAFGQYDQTLLGLHGWDNYHLGTTMAWDSVADLRGVKIAGAGPNLPWLEFAGTVPVQSTLPEGYLAMSTGVYNGWLMFPSAYLGYKYYEPAPHYTLIGFGAVGVVGLTMNTASLERLPQDVQQIIREVGAAYEARSGEQLNSAQQRGLDGLKAAGADIKTVGDQVRAEWAQSLAGFPKSRAEEADGRGLPGTEVMKAYFEAVASLGYRFPVPYSVD